MSSVTTVDRIGKIKHRRGELKYTKKHNSIRQQPIRTSLEGVCEVSIIGDSQRQAEQISTQTDYVYIYIYHLSYPQTEDEMKLS